MSFLKNIAFCLQQPTNHKHRLLMMFLSSFLPLRSKLFVWYSLSKRNDFLTSVVCYLFWDSLTLLCHSPMTDFPLCWLWFLCLLGLLKVFGRRYNFCMSTDSGGINYIQILMTSIFCSQLVGPQRWVVNKKHCTMRLKWNSGCQNLHLYPYKPEVSRRVFLLSEFRGLSWFTPGWPLKRTTGFGLKYNR